MFDKNKNKDNSEKDNNFRKDALSTNAPASAKVSIGTVEFLPQ